MTAEVNGHAPAPPPQSDQALDIARAVVEKLHHDSPDLEAWADLTEEEQGSEYIIAQHYVAAHISWLMDRGFKIVPPGASPIPKTDEEAFALLQAAKGYFDGKKRRGKLMTGAVERKLILPKRSKLQ